MSTDLEKIYKALANRRRLAIIKLLRQNKQITVGDISDHLHLSFRSTSKHLAVLRSVDVIEREQKGLEVYYALSDQVHPVVRQYLSMV